MYRKIIVLTTILVMQISIFANNDFSNKDYREHIDIIKKEDTNKTIMVVKPFVIITDINSSSTQQDIKRIIELSTMTFKRLFFKNNPENIIDIWILKNRAEYIKFNHALLNSTSRDDVAGYYMKDKNALVLDITTGIGTIVHEMVHAFMDNNFPDAPAWFDEGLASLYEGLISDNQGIKGDLNWRLPLLKQTIRADKLNSFKRLTDMNATEFYNNQTVSINYAQARYIFYYLQEKGLLTKFYQTALANIKKDPTCYESLKHILDKKDMKKFTKEWEKYILELENYMHYIKRMTS